MAREQLSNGERAAEGAGSEPVLDLGVTPVEGEPLQALHSVMKAVADTMDRVK